MEPFCVKTLNYIPVTCKTVITKIGCLYAAERSRTPEHVIFEYVQAIIDDNDLK